MSSEIIVKETSLKGVLRYDGMSSNSSILSDFMKYRVEIFCTELTYIRKRCNCLVQLNLLELSWH